MKIIYSGGYDKNSTQSIDKNVISRYANFIDNLIRENKRVAFVTLAKLDDQYYLPLLQEKIAASGYDVINYATLDSAQWSSYDLMVFFGGNTINLKNSLAKSGFSLDQLKKDCVLIGDSAGAQVLGAWFYDADKIQNDWSVSFHEGFFAKSEKIYIVHSNNTRYVDEKLKKIIQDFANQHKMTFLYLAENEELKVNIQI